MATSPTDDPLSFYTKVPILRHRDVGDEHHGGEGGAGAGVPREGAVRDGAAGVGAGAQAARGVRAAYDGLPLPVLPSLAPDDAEDGLMAGKKIRAVERELRERIEICEELTSIGSGVLDNDFRDARARLVGYRELLAVVERLRDA
jgi:hypothetical protein